MLSQGSIPEKNGIFGVLPSDCFVTVILFFTPTEIAKFPVVSSHWKKIIKEKGQPYWKQQCLYIGLNVQALKATEACLRIITEESKQEDNVHGSESFLYYKNLYASFNRLPRGERHGVREPWELYCLSGQPELILEKITAAANDMGASALHYTALSGSLDALKRVLKIKELDPLARDNIGRTLLHYAAVSGSVKVLDYVLTLKGIDRSAENYFRKPLLFYAARSGSLNVIYRVLRMDIGYVSRLRKNTNKRLLAQNAAVLLEPIAKSGSVDILNQLLTENPHFLFFRNENDNTLFHWVALSGSVEILDQVLKKLEEEIMLNDRLCLADPNRQNKRIKLKNFPLRKDRQGETILHYAACSGSVAVFKRALEITGICSVTYPGGKPIEYFQEIDPLERSYENSTILHWAGWGGSIPLFKLILEIKGIALLELDQKGRTVLHYAAWNGSVELFEHIILEIPEIKPLARDEEGRTVLHYAALSGSASLFKCALRIPGINPLDRDNFGRTVLHAAVLHPYGSLEILKCILEIEGMDLSALDNDSKNVLHHAALGGSVECVVYLYAHRNKFNFDFALSIRNINLSSLSEDMRNILFFIKADIQGVDIKKADFCAKILLCGVAILTTTFAIIALVSSFPIMSFIITLLGILVTASVSAEAIRVFDNRSCFARFFRPSSNPFEQYNYRRSFSSPPSVAVAAEESPDQSFVPTLG